MGTWSLSRSTIRQSNNMKLHELKVSKSVRKANPHLFGYGVGAGKNDQPKPTSVAPLVRRGKTPQVGKGSVGVLVTLIAYRRRLLDDDNNCASFKALRDAVARTLGVDDRDGRVVWRYGQVETRGEEGVVVRIESYLSKGSKTSPSAAASSMMS